MSILADSSDEQKRVMFQILGYALEGLRAELSWEYKVALYGDLTQFLMESFIKDDLPDHLIGSMNEVAQYLISEHHTSKKGIN